MAQKQMSRETKKCYGCDRCQKFLPCWRTTLRPFFHTITILLAQNHNHNETFLSYYPTTLDMQQNGSRKGIRFLLLEVPLGRTQQLKYSHTHCFYFSPKYFIVHLLLFSHFKGYVYPYELFSDGRLFWELWSPFYSTEYHL